MIDRLGPTPLGALPRGHHACLMYRAPDEAMHAVAPFLEAGLQQNERCVYVLGEHELARVKSVLEAHGTRVDEALARGALVFVDRWEVSFPNGEFDPAAMIVYVREAIADALRAGFSALRVIAEMTWALQMGTGHNKLIHYEALGNHLYPDEPLVAVCMYDLTRFPSAVCHDALRVHPVVSTGAEASENPYYERPDSVIDGPHASEHVDWMLQQLDRMRSTEQERSELLQLRAAKEARDGLLSELAHELRNPLATIVGTIDAALAHLGKTHPPDGAVLRKYVERIGRQTQKQAQLIEQVLAAARLASGSLPLEPRAFDLAALVVDVLEAARVASPKREIHLDTQAGAHVVADPLRIEQVLNNLLDNGLKFSPEGTPLEVTLREVDGDGYELSVRDHGVGIAPELRERVFERYYRAHTGYRGLGLGLHISAEILRQHGGRIVAEAAEGGGTRMVVHLPAAPMGVEAPGWNQRRAFV